MKLRCWLSSLALSCWTAVLLGAATWHWTPSPLNGHLGKLLVLSVFLTAAWWQAPKRRSPVRKAAPKPAPAPSRSPKPSPVAALLDGIHIHS